jgi:hypothetical protein
MDNELRDADWLTREQDERERDELERLRKKLDAAERQFEELCQAQLELRVLEVRIPQLRAAVAALENLLTDPDIRGQSSQTSKLPDSNADIGRGQRSKKIKIILMETDGIMSPQSVMDELQRRHQLGVSQDPLRAIQAALRRLEQTDDEIIRVGYGRYRYRPKEQGMDA